MRDTPEGIVEELRDGARVEALELGVPAEELTASQAADHIEHLRGHLQRIAAGEDEPARIAAEALDVKLWVLGAEKEPG
jgi:hypothetical protein